MPAAAKGIFQQIRRAVLRIPKGKVATYGAVARAAGLPGYARQVAWALRNPPVPLPWHRVLGAGGRISLPGSAGLEQRLRLEAEGVRFSGSRVRMGEHEFGYNQADAKPARGRAGGAPGRGSGAVAKRRTSR
jgi:methylated-DNA-protein-cysteine methyltransferase-like protein